MPNGGQQMLDLASIVSGYGRKQILNGIDLRVDAAEIVGVIGHNGAGKSTLLKAVFGLLPLWKGRLTLDKAVLTRQYPSDLLARGVAYVPQGNRVFSELTVAENLAMGAILLRDQASVTEGMARVFDLFPLLRTRLDQRAGTLSGGERQMVALGSALVMSPRLVLLDEPSLGLAPPLIMQIFERIRRIRDEDGTAFLIVEQKVRELLRTTERVYVFRNGQISYSGSSASLYDEAALKKAFL